jgi:hypothetical protein
MPPTPVGACKQEFEIDDLSRNPPTPVGARHGKPLQMKSEIKKSSLTSNPAQILLQQSRH